MSGGVIGSAIASFKSGKLTELFSHDGIIEKQLQDKKIQYKIYKQCLVNLGCS